MKIYMTVVAAMMLATVAMAQDGGFGRGRIENVTDGEDWTVSADAKRRALGSVAEAPLVCVGSPKIPVVLVQFDDKKFSVAESDDSVKVLYGDFFNAGEGVHPGEPSSFGSVKEYFRQQSDGQFTPEFEVVGPVTLSKSYKYYGEDGAVRKDVNISQFYSEACKLAVQESVDWSDFDNDGDGVVDMVFFIYAGEGQNGSDDKYTIWPKESASSITVEYDNKSITFGAYGCTNERFKNGQDGIGPIVHELSHGLGLPDFYDTVGSAFGLDYWDIMDSGCYQINGYQPCCMSAYERDFMGWRKLVELAPDTACTLTLSPIEEDGVGYKIVNKANPDEYFILENRQNIGFDKYLGCPSQSILQKYGACHGLQITHVDYVRSAWSGNRVNADAKHQRMTIVPADKDVRSNLASGYEEWAESLHGDLYPGEANVTEISSYDVFTGTALDQTISNIVEHEDGTITVDINGGTPEANGVESVKGTFEDIIAVYSLEGVKQSELRRGVNIVKYGDGQVKKIYVK